MATKNAEPIINLNSVKEESNLPEVMASLEMLTVNTNAAVSSSPKIGTKRILRKRIPRTDAVPVTANRRCSRKPRKRGHSEMETDSDIREYYLDKSIKLSPNNLETISEERKAVAGNDNGSESSVYIGAKKFKRMIEFQKEPTASKLKKRRNKIKRVFGKNILTRRKFTMKALFDKLNNMQAESSPEFESDEK